MKVTKRHLEVEMKYLESVLAVIARQGSVADKAMHERWKEVGEFKKYLWERGGEMDLAELAENRRSANLEISKKLVILPSYLSKGLEFDGVISYSELGTPYTESEKHLYYVVCTRAQHRLVVYNPPAWPFRAPP